MAGSNKLYRLGLARFILPDPAAFDAAAYSTREIHEGYLVEQWMNLTGSELLYTPCYGQSKQIPPISQWSLDILILISWYLFPALHESSLATPGGHAGSRS